MTADRKRRIIATFERARQALPNRAVAHKRRFPRNTQSRNWDLNCTRLLGASRSDAGRPPRQRRPEGWSIAVAYGRTAKSNGVGALPAEWRPGGRDELLFTWITCWGRPLHCNSAPRRTGARGSLPKCVHLHGGGRPLAPLGGAIVSHRRGISNPGTTDRAP